LPIPKAMAQATQAAAGPPVRVGIIVPSHCALPMLHAQLSGFYEQNGIAVEIHPLPTSNAIANGLVEGRLEVGQVMTPYFYSATLGSGPFADRRTPLVTAQVAGSNGGVLVVAWDSPVRTPKDLRGKTIGVHSPYMTHNLIINILLESHGIDPAKDVTIKVVPMDRMIAALDQREIDAFINPEPLGTFAMEQAVGKELLLTKRLWRSHPCCLVAMRRDFLVKNSERAKAVYRSSLTSGLLLDNFRTRIEAIEKTHARSDSYRKIPLETVIKAFVPGRSDFAPFPFQSSARAILILMRQAGLAPQGIDIDTVVEQTILSNLSRELLTELGGKPPASNNRPETIVGKVIA
jgi:nitrate/nitrite transport system substrate-binding protein